MISLTTKRRKRKARTAARRKLRWTGDREQRMYFEVLYANVRAAYPLERPLKTCRAAAEHDKYPWVSSRLFVLLKQTSACERLPPCRTLGEVVQSEQERAIADAQVPTSLTWSNKRSRFHAKCLSKAVAAATEMLTVSLLGAGNTKHERKTGNCLLS